MIDTAGTAKWNHWCKACGTLEEHVARFETNGGRQEIVHDVCQRCGLTHDKTKDHVSAADKHEPPPTPNDNRAVWDVVLEDIRARDAEGRRKYGTPLQPHNGRDAMWDLYQELLDAVVYCRQAIMERDGASR